MGFYPTRPKTVDDLSEDDRYQTRLLTISRNILDVEDEESQRVLLTVWQVARFSPSGVHRVEQFNEVVLFKIPTQEELEAILKTEQKAFDVRTEGLERWQKGEEQSLLVSEWGLARAAQIRGIETSYWPKIVPGEP